MEDLSMVDGVRVAGEWHQIIRGSFGRDRNPAGDTFHFKKNDGDYAGPWEKVDVWRQAPDEQPT